MSEQEISSQEAIDPTSPQRFNDITLGIQLLPFEVQQEIAKVLLHHKDQNGLILAEYEHILDALAETKNTDLQYELAIECGFHQLHSQMYFSNETSTSMKACIVSHTEYIDIIKDALKSEDPVIRESLAQNKNLHRNTLETLSKDSEQSVLIVLAESVLSDGDKPKNLSYHVVRNLILGLKNEVIIGSLIKEFPQTMANARSVTIDSLAKLGFRFEV